MVELGRTNCEQYFVVSLSKPTLAIFNVNFWKYRYVFVVPIDMDNTIYKIRIWINSSVSTHLDKMDSKFPELVIVFFKKSPSLKVEVLSSPPCLFENLVGGSPSPPPPCSKKGREGGGVHTMFVISQKSHFSCCCFH